MSWISAITDSYRRFRHSKGFGVHSPFAYALITEALYPSRGYMYYLESDPRLESAAPADSRRTRALYRVCLFLRNSLCPVPRIYIFGEAPQSFAKAARLAGCTLVSRSDLADCLILSGNHESGLIASLRQTSLPEKDAKGALILGGRTMTIAVRRSGMADIIYTLP